MAGVGSAGIGFFGKLPDGVSDGGKVLTEQASTGAHRTHAPGPVMTGSSQDTIVQALLDLVLSSLDQDGAEEVVAIDLKGKTSVADHMVVASGRSNRHVSSISDKLVERLKAETDYRVRVEGKEAADWVLIDAGDVIVHVFRPEVRDFYQLEKMWSPAPDRTARAL